MDIDNAQESILESLANKYIWWKTARDAVRHPHKVIRQVMNIGEYDDVLSLLNVFSESTLTDILTKSEVGEFNEKSWVFWHYKLGISGYGDVPPLPSRRFENEYV